MELSDYSINASEKYWPIEYAQYDGRAITQNRKFWTLTVHDPHCRYAQRDKSGLPYQPYFGSDGLLNLAQRGLTAPNSRYTGSVWQGCKVCGTASQPNENWKARGQKILDDQKAADARANEKRKAQGIINAAKDAFEKAQRDAAIKWQEAHKAELDGVRLEAGAAWIRDNPEQAHLLDAGLQDDLRIIRKYDSN